MLVAIYLASKTPCSADGYLFLNKKKKDNIKIFSEMPRITLSRLICYFDFINQLIEDPIRERTIEISTDIGELIQQGYIQTKKNDSDSREAERIKPKIEKEQVVELTKSIGFNLFDYIKE